MKILKVSAYMLFLLLLTSCITPSKSMRTLVDDSKNEGMVVGTVCLENRKFDGYTFFYKGTSSELTSENIAVSGNIKIQNSSGDYKAKRKRYYLFSIVRPAGKYTFNEISLWLNTGYMQSTRSADIDLPFEIEKGKTVYLGEIKLDTKNGIFEKNNEIERDRKWFNEKFPQIKF